MDSKKKGELEFHQFLPDGPCPQMAFADPERLRDLADHLEIDPSAIDSMRNQVESLRDQLEQWNTGEYFSITQEQAEAFQKQAEQLANSFRDRNFGIDPKQMDEFNRQMRQFQRQFKGIDPKQMDQLKERMKKQMDQFRQQLEEMQDSGVDHMV